MPRTPAQALRVPACVAAASAVGLVSALLEDGPWGRVSWPVLGGVLVIAAWHGLPWSRLRRRPGTALSAGEQA